MNYFVFNCARFQKSTREKMKLDLLKQLCAIHAPSGNESAMTDFLLQYIHQNKSNWKVAPVIHHGGDFQEMIVLVFGNPTTAVFSHIDNIGFTAKYGKELVKIGGPRIKDGYQLKGTDSQGYFEIEIEDSEGQICYKGERKIERGTDLSFVQNWREDENYVQSCYLDNRLGNWVALKLAETLENGIICFSTYEEHGGGGAEFLAKFVYENYKVNQALICDITWVTEGVLHGEGVAISMRDSGVPRRKYLNRIIELAKKSNVKFQLEVESAGGSDGNAIHRTPYPFNWCFIGAPEDNVHTPNEKVHKFDIQTMLELYQFLMKEL